MKKAETLLILAGLTLLAARSAPAVEAGAACLDITPRTGLQMIGFSSRVAQSVLDSLHVRALVFRDGEHSVGFVVYDLLFPFNDKINTEMRRIIRERTGLAEVVFSATHTHSGPWISYAGGPDAAAGLDELKDYERMICDRTLEALEKAYNSLQPVRLGTGLGEVDLNYNRIRQEPDGRVEMIWANHEKIPLGPAASSVAVIRIDDLQGKTLALLVNYACHPVIHGRPNENLMYSADFPGALCAEVASRLPDHPQCIFINGACGDMNPYYAHSVENPKPRIAEVGHKLADEVLRVAGEIETRPCEAERPLRFQVRHFATTGRWDKVKGEEGEAANAGKGRRESAAGMLDTLELPLDLALLTPEIGFVGLPGEFFSAFQQELRGRAPVKFLIVAGYTDGSFGYFPTIPAAVTGGYGANDEATYTRPGTGEHLMIEALVGLHELLGELRPAPADPSKGYRY